MKYDIGFLSGIIAVAILFLSSVISIVSAEKYDFVNQYISELGTTPYGYLFNYSIIISSVLFILFYISIYRKLSLSFYKESRSRSYKNLVMNFFVRNKNALLKISVIIGLISCIPLALVGFFIGLNPYHTIVASSFFFMVSISTLILSFYLKSEKILAYELIVSAIGFLFGLIHYTGGESQLLQKLIAVGYLLWFGIVSAYFMNPKKTLYKKLR